MHLWPSTRLRDSFKQGYLKKLEWNLHRMKSEKNQSSENTKLLDQANEQGDSTGSGCGGAALVFCRDLLMIFSCCYCCGACVDREEN